MDRLSNTSLGSFVPLLGHCHHLPLQVTTSLMSATPCWFCLVCDFTQWHTCSIFAWCFSLSTTSVGSVFVTASVTYSSFWPSSACSPMGGHSSGFQFWLLWIKLLWTSFWCTLSSPSSWVNTEWNCWFMGRYTLSTRHSSRYRQTDFHSGWATFHFCCQCMWALMRLGIFSLLKFSHYGATIFLY